MRAVLDTNVFVSMLLGGQVGKINQAWIDEQFTLVLSEAIVSEYLDVLSRPKLHLTGEIVSVIMARIQRKAEFITPEEKISVIESDPEDNKFLEAAIAGNVNYIVSGDSHLLQQKSFREISIITAREFVELLDSREAS